MKQTIRDLINIAIDVFLVLASIVMIIGACWFVYTTIKNFPTVEEQKLKIDRATLEKEECSRYSTLNVGISPMKCLKYYYR